MCFAFVKVSMNSQISQIHSLQTILTVPYTTKAHPNIFVSLKVSDLSENLQLSLDVSCKNSQLHQKIQLIFSLKS